MRQAGLLSTSIEGHYAFLKLKLSLVFLCGTGTVKQSYLLRIFAPSGVIDRKYRQLAAPERARKFVRVQSFLYSQNFQSCEQYLEHLQRLFVPLLILRLHNDRGQHFISKHGLQLLHITFHSFQHLTRHLKDFLFVALMKLNRQILLNKTVDLQPFRC